MGKYVLIVIFFILFLAGFVLSGYLLFLEKKEWSVFIISAFTALISLGGLIWQMCKKPDPKPTHTKTVGSIIISGKGNDFTGAAIGGINVKQKNITKNL